MANSEYEKLFAESLAEIEAVPPMTAAERAYAERCFAAMDECYAQENPTPCRRDKNCVRAGGCYYCLVIRPRCGETDRRMNKLGKAEFSARHEQRQNEPAALKRNGLLIHCNNFLITYARDVVTHLSPP